MNSFKKYLFLFSALSMLLYLNSCIGDDIIFDTVAETVIIKNPIDSLGFGTSYQFEAVFNNNVGQQETRSILWQSSDSSIIGITINGLATGHQTGMAIITATAAETASMAKASIPVIVGENTTATATDRMGVLKTTSSYTLEGSFVLKEEGDKLVLTLNEDYLASSNLPGLYLYLTNNPNTTNGAFEVGAVSVFSGTHSYTLPDDIELNSYNYLLYFCKPFRVKVGDGKFDE